MKQETDNKLIPLVKSEGLPFHLWFWNLHKAAVGYKFQETDKQIVWFYDNDYSVEDAWQEIFENMESESDD